MSNYDAHAEARVILMTEITSLRTQLDNEKRRADALKAKVKVLESDLQKESKRADDLDGELDDARCKIADLELALEDQEL